MSASLFGRADARGIVVALVLAAVGALGALPGARGADPAALVLWLSVWAPVAGALAGAARLALWPLGASVPGVWMMLVVAVDAAAERDLPAPLWAACAWTGLFALGLALGWLARGPWPVAAVLLLVGGTLAVAPAGAGVLAEPLPPRVVARLLDASPPAFVAECAGIDWMRHPWVYEGAGTAHLDPSLRVPYRGSLAGPVVLLVGCACAAVARRRSRRPEEERG